jgi:hypothetical protein
MSNRDVKDLLELIAYCDPVRPGLPASTYRETIRRQADYAREALAKLAPAPPRDERPPCPGPRCPMCAGEACSLCGAGCWDSSVRNCQHDAIDRHRGPPYSL